MSQPLIDPKLPSYLAIAKDGGPGSLSSCTAALVRGLSQAGHRVTVITTRPDVIDKAVADLPVACVHNPLPDDGSPWELFKKWSQGLAPVAADRAILVRGFAGATSAALNLAVRRHVKRVYTVEQSLPEHLSAMNPGVTLKRRGALAQRVRDKIASAPIYRSLAVSEAVRRSLIDYYHFKPEQVVTCWNWADTVRFKPDDEARRATRQSIGVGEKDWLIGYVGRLSPEKRVDLVVRGFAGLLNRRPMKMKLVIVGAGPEEPGLKTLAQALGVSDQVHFAGFSNEPQAWHRAVDVEVLASRFEGLPLSILEAMACGAVVLVNVVSGTPECVTDDDNGFITPIEDAAVITQRLESIVTLPPERIAALRKRARESVLEKFSLRVGLARMLDGLDAPGAAERVRTTLRDD